MTRYFSSNVQVMCFFFATIAMSSAVEAQQKQSSAAPLAKMELADGDCVVFLGDSITHQRLYTQYVENFFYTRFPNMRLKFHNAGVGGAKAWDALERFDRDVARYKPKYVTVLLGMNDARYQPFNLEIFSTYQQDMTKVVSQIVGCGAQPILMTPTMFDARAARGSQRKRDDKMLAEYNSVLAYYGTWLRDVAVKNGHGFVDMWGPLNNLTLSKRKHEPDFTMIADAIHPGPSGQLVMAYTIIEDMGFRGGVSNIRVVRDAKGKARAQSSGGKVTDIKLTDDGLEFTWTANGLPWVLPKAADVGRKLLRLGHRASREGLEVHVLQPGKYTLTIDDQEIGTFTSIQLSRHIELQENDATPQYQQAAKVAELNKQRNEGPIGKLRSEWSRFQRYARLKDSIEKDPSLKQKQGPRLESLVKQMENMDERVAQFEAEALKLEDEIFEINQPIPRRYVLKRVQ